MQIKFLDGQQTQGEGWHGQPLGNGIGEINCSDWPGFNDFCAKLLTRIHSNVFRGQALSSWKLRSTLDRKLDEMDTSEIADKKLFAVLKLREKHLNNFKAAARGRTDAGVSRYMSEDNWWSLGQHYGLATPLLDWTESPYVAAFFAFHEENHGNEGTAVIYALSRPTIERKVEEVRRDLGPEFDPGEVVRFLTPLSVDNARLINQRGLFTIAPGEVCFEDWVKNYFKGSEEVALLKIKIPRSERSTALRQMNRMNISHLTLFPDLGGASDYCNMQLWDRFY